MKIKRLIEKEYDIPDEFLNKNTCAYFDKEKGTWFRCPHATVQIWTDSDGYDDETHGCVVFDKQVDEGTEKIKKNENTSYTFPIRLKECRELKSKGVT